MKCFSGMNNTTELSSPVDFLEKPTQKKLRNEFLAECHKMNENEKKSFRARTCGSYLEFAISPTEKKLKSANFCKARLCPMCNWRLSQKRFGNLSAVTELSKSNKYQLLFLTLTAKNVPGNDLNNEIKRFFNAWRNLTRYSHEFNKAVHGWFRALEVTYNKEDDNYHPHLHIVLAVKSTYFKKSGYYITQEKWSEIWAHYLNIDYIPVVHIQKVYTKKGSSAESEASKYTVKDTDYLIENDLNLSSKVVQILDDSLRRVRLIAYGGVLKKYYSELQLNEEKLTDDLENITEDLAYIIEKYRWNFGTKLYQKIIED
jgi:plasmid rolling circle replication initiator protein Rep